MPSVTDTEKPSSSRRSIGALAVATGMGIALAAFATESIAAHDERVAQLAAEEKALRESVAKLSTEHAALRDEIAKARAEAKRARCDADFEKVQAAAVGVQARAFAERARYMQCVAQLEQSHSEGTAAGCAAGAFIAGPLGALLCLGSAAAGDSAAVRCGLEPTVPTGDVAYVEAQHSTGITLDDECLLAQVELNEG